MANFDTSGLALAAVCPSNKMILDDKGMPGFYVQVAAQKLSDLITGGDDTVHPAFRVSGVEKPYIYIGKYQGVEDNGRIYSLPGVDPKVSITLNQYEARCRAKGAGHHCITAAEWAFLALWCRKNGAMPNGNNSYGKDATETMCESVPATYGTDGRINRTLTGTGPLTWRHNRALDGIADLNGNVWEWVTGIRLVKGELQVIPYNNAADPDVDTGADSAQWKAIRANATSWENLFITPNGSGATSGSVKLDYASDHWQWDTAITSQENSTRSAAYHLTTAASGIGSIAKLYLQSMALLPEDNQETDTYDGDTFGANNAADEMCAYRGGSWSNGKTAGIFYINFRDSRAYSDSSFLGGRPAFVALPS